MKYIVTNVGLIDGDNPTSACFMFLQEDSKGDEYEILEGDFKAEYPDSCEYNVRIFDKNGVEVNG